jgi:hypothetical protein
MSAQVAREPVSVLTAKAARAFVSRCNDCREEDNKTARKVSRNDYVRRCSGNVMISAKALYNSVVSGVAPKKNVPSPELGQLLPAASTLS